MSKIPKHPDKEQKLKKKHRTDEEFAYRSVLISAILGGIFFIISIFLNIEIVTIFMNIDVIWTLIDILIKVIVILLFFLFMTTSIGNYKELVGKPLNWKDLLLLFLLSIGQAILNPFVFVFTLFGLAIISIYLYVVQEM